MKKKAVRRPAKNKRNKQTYMHQTDGRAPFEFARLKPNRDENRANTMGDRSVHLLVALVPEAVPVVHTRGGTDRPPRRGDHAAREKDRRGVPTVGVQPVNQPVRRSGVQEPIVPLRIGFETQ